MNKQGRFYFRTQLIYNIKYSKVRIMAEHKAGYGPNHPVYTYGNRPPHTYTLKMRKLCRRLRLKAIPAHIISARSENSRIPAKCSLTSFRVSKLKVSTLEHFFENVLIRFVGGLSSTYSRVG